jgi:pimeloyl-ACP methyl ester carboxylesterase
MLHQHARPLSVDSELVQISCDGVRLHGMLAVPPSAIGLVIFAHGSGSSRHSPRNKLIARAVREQCNAATLLVDLLSDTEESVDERTHALRFDIPLLAQRVRALCIWASWDRRTRTLPVGLFGASTGAAASLIAASEVPERVACVVTRGGRPDLAGVVALSTVRAPTLFIVGSNDDVVLRLNREALPMMSDARLEVVLGASHLFAEPGTLQEAATLAARFYARHLRAR